MDNNTQAAYQAGRSVNQGTVLGPDSVAVLPALPSTFANTPEMVDAWEQGVVDARMAAWETFRHAFDNFASVFSDSDLADAAGTALTCTEVEALAELLRASGRGEAAEAWIEGHAVDDDCGDEHCVCDECKA
jgi:hypothetical protein